MAKVPKYQVENHILHAMRLSKQDGAHMAAYLLEMALIEIRDHYDRREVLKTSVAN